MPQKSIEVVGKDKTLKNVRLLVVLHSAGTLSFATATFASIMARSPELAALNLVNTGANAYLAVRRAQELHTLTNSSENHD